MGQQQLLLVILVTIIVGIATVVAINIFGTSAENANRDAVRQDLLSAATAAQGWWMKPEMMDGGGRSFEGITTENLGIAGILNAAGTIVTNENGTYEITAAGAGDGVDPTTSTFTITGTPSAGTPPIVLEVTFEIINGRAVPQLIWDGEAVDQGQG